MPRAARMAALLGRPLMGWQGEWLAGALEVDDDTGAMAWPVVVGVVPRRAGKTYAGGLVNLLTASVRRAGARGWYTAHTREVGARLWRREWFPMLGTRRLAPVYRLRRSNGSESIETRRLSSTVDLFGPPGESIRSQDADVVVVDEARRLTLEVGEALEAAIRGAQLRRAATRQLWVLSSAGDTDADYLRRYRDLGRAGAGGLHYLEYGAGPDDDLDDPAVWARVHPAVASGDVSVASLQADRATFGVDSFNMEVLGVWRDPADVASLLTPEVWAAAAWDGTPGAPLTFAADVAPDRSHASVVAAGTGPDGTVAVELIDDRPGVGWVAAALAALKRAHRGARVIVDGLVAASVVLELQRAGVTVDEVNGADYARACGLFVDLVVGGRLHHHQAWPLTDAVLGATRRPLGDAWAWSRTRSALTITPAVAATLATWGHLHRPRGRAMAVAAR